MDELQLLNAIREIVKGEILPLKTELTEFKKETTSSLQEAKVERAKLGERITNVEVNLQEAKAERAKLGERITNVEVNLQEAKAERAKLGERITNVETSLREAKAESTSNFQKVEMNFQIAQDERTKLADTLEGGLAMLNKVEQRLNPVADYVETVFLHANESNHT